MSGPGRAKTEWIEVALSRLFSWGPYFSTLSDSGNEMIRLETAPSTVIAHAQITNLNMFTVASGMHQRVTRYTRTARLSTTLAVFNGQLLLRDLAKKELVQLARGIRSFIGSRKIAAYGSTKMIPPRFRCAFDGQIHDLKLKARDS